MELIVTHERSVNWAYSRPITRPYQHTIVENCPFKICAKRLKIYAKTLEGAHFRIHWLAVDCICAMSNLTLSSRSPNQWWSQVKQIIHVCGRRSSWSPLWWWLCRPNFFLLEIDNLGEKARCVYNGWHFCHFFKRANSRHHTVGLSQPSVSLKREWIVAKLCEIR